MMKYIYFIAYAHERGWGNKEISCSYILDGYAKLQNIAEVIEKNSGSNGVVIVSFQLLRTE